MATNYALQSNGGVASTPDGNSPGYPVTRINDGNLSTEWYAQDAGFPKTVFLTLSTIRAINQVKVYFLAGYKPGSWSVYYKNSGGTYTLIETQTDNSGSSYTHNFATDNTDEIKVVSNSIGSGQSNFAAWNEIEVWGDPAADTIAPSDVTNLTATKINNGQVDIDSDIATDNVAIAGYQTQRRINGGSWVTLTPTSKAFSDTENFPTTAGTYSFEYRRKAFDTASPPNYSTNWSNITSPVSITVVASLQSTYSPNSNLSAPVIITFDDVSAGTVTDQRIKFGDFAELNQADAANFTHLYLAPGTYKFERWAKLGGIPSYETYNIIIGGNPPTPPVGAIEFDEIELPRYYSEGASGGPVFSTGILGNPNAVQQRNINRPTGIHEYELNFPGEDQFGDKFEEFLDFFHTRQGMAIGFRFFPFVDNRWNDELISLTNTSTSIYKLIRTYKRGGRIRIRRIVKPVPNLIVKINGNPATNYSAYTIDYTTGKITFTTPANLPVNGELRVTGQYCIPVTFADDKLNITGYASYADLNGIRVIELLPSALGITD